MENLKHTKGKWAVKHSLTKDAFNVIGTELGGNYKIARCPYLKVETLSKEWNDKEKSECEANSKLIAAAPELFEALIELRKETLNLIEHCVDQSFLDWEDESIDGVTDMNQKLEKAINAIKKATE